MVASTIEEGRTCETARFVGGRAKSPGSVFVFWRAETRNVLLTKIETSASIVFVAGSNSRRRRQISREAVSRFAPPERKRLFYI